jgi:cysteinyl-tRNA synthetase
MHLRLFNTETREKEEIIPTNGKEVRLYTCGPTIYDFAHIGNFRTYVFEDLLKRTLNFLGMSVRHVMNLTDVDDKTIKGALKKAIPLQEYTDPYKFAFFEDVKALSIDPANFYPEATLYIPQMIQIIQSLLDKKIAYIGADLSVYFSIDRFPSYGRLSRLNLNELQKGKRISSDEYDKENVSDFVLWKSYDEKRDGYIFWESPFGKGRPGWHIECSAMALELLGSDIDIHCGGVDNMFPHHENEMAQSEAFTGKRFVAHWAHSEHLVVDGKKMSKSLGNFFTLRQLLQKGYTGAQIRYLLMQTHYRSQLNFTFAGLDAAKAALDRLSDFILRLSSIGDASSFGLLQPFVVDTEEKFSTALADDLNISSALGALFDFVREVNTLCDQKKISKKEAEEALSFLRRIDTILACLPFDHQIEIPLDVKEALQKREEARKVKDWKSADHYRDLIVSKGYIIEDRVEGARVKNK